MELIISIAILGISSTSIFGLARMAIGASDIHHKQSVAGRILDDFAEYLQNEQYHACPTDSSPTYDADRTSFVSSLATLGTPVYDPAASVYTLSVTVSTGVPAPGSTPSVTYPDPATPAACATATDKGIQRLTLTVASPDGHATESVQIVKWKR
jgi:type II secretory pathway pseudopilin PulG